MGSAFCSFGATFAGVSFAGAWAAGLAGALVVVGFFAVAVAMVVSSWTGGADPVVGPNYDLAYRGIRLLFSRFVAPIGPTRLWPAESSPRICLAVARWLDPCPPPPRRCRADQCCTAQH